MLHKTGLKIQIHVFMFFRVCQAREVLRAKLEPLDQRCNVPFIHSDAVKCFSAVSVNSLYKCNAVSAVFVQLRAVTARRESSVFPASKETWWDFIMCCTLWPSLIGSSIFNGAYKDVTTVTQCLCVTFCNLQGIRGQRAAKGEPGTRGTMVSWHI